MRLPPDLLYLVIYNTTLKAENVDVDVDDEDAEEQAHILFYTAKERAVAKNKMLRQVGLAKALVNFSLSVLSGFIYAYIIYLSLSKDIRYTSYL